MKEKLIELFNSKDTSEKTGEEILENISRAYNVFGSYSKISKEIFDGLSKEGKNRFVLIWALSGMELAYHWIMTNFDDWDERKKYSEMFSHKNLSLLEDILKENGLDIPLSMESKEEVKRYAYFPSWLSKKIGRENFKGNEWLLKYAEKWNSLHSTLKQSYFGGVYNGIIEPMYPNKFSTNLQYGGQFPLI